MMEPGGLLNNLNAFFISFLLLYKLYIYTHQWRRKVPKHWGGGGGGGRRGGAHRQVIYVPSVKN